MILQAIFVAVLVGACVSAAPREGRGNGGEEWAFLGSHGRVLFQGDSITDGNRGRSSDPNHILGHGYAFILSAKLGAMYPERGWEFVNRGVSGNTVGDLVKRWETDAVEIKPGVISILVGVNDIGRGVGLEESERAYDGLLAETREKLPGVRLVLLEPFGLPVGKVKEHWAERSAKLAAWRGTVERLGAKHGAVVVKLQKVFDEACGRAPAEYWIWDGVHPTYRGHQLIADEWERVVKGARVGDSATRPKGEGK